MHEEQTFNHRNGFYSTKVLGTSNLISECVFNLVISSKNLNAIIILNFFTLNEKFGIFSDFNNVLTMGPITYILILSCL